MLPLVLLVLVLVLLLLEGGWQDFQPAVAVRLVGGFGAPVVNARVCPTGYVSLLF